jgi:hypothetical protein
MGYSLAKRIGDYKMTSESEPIVTSNKQTVPDPEIQAISAVYEALRQLDQEAQLRVLDYVTQKLKLRKGAYDDAQRRIPPAETPVPDKHIEPISADPGEAEIEGVSPIAAKWIQRNGLNVDDMMKVFSLGVDDIDYVGNSIPGDSMRARMFNLVLLKGVAAYLSTGSARFGHEQLKQTCEHYNAYDSANFARYLKEFAADVSGSKESGYTLTARGLNNAAQLVKQLTVRKGT